MENQIFINKMSILWEGDPPVGISGSRWEISGGFYFEDKEDMGFFLEELKTPFENFVGDKVKIYIETLVQCPYCLGKTDTTKIISCPKCNGLGKQLYSYFV